ncbi:UNVERIFIED_CONTAM: hypothetical protein Sindi_0104700 [Sesamum indicum]
MAVAKSHSVVVFSSITLTHDRKLVPLDSPAHCGSNGTSFNNFHQLGEKIHPLEALDHRPPQKPYSAAVFSVVTPTHGHGLVPLDSPAHYGSNGISFINFHQLGEKIHPLKALDRRPPPFSPSSRRPTVADHHYSLPLVVASCLRPVPSFFINCVQRSCNFHLLADIVRRAAVRRPFAECLAIAQFHAAPFTATLDGFLAFPMYSFPGTYPAVFTTVSHLVHLNADVFHQGFSLVIPVLLAFLQLKYQGNQETPFSTHPKTTGLAVSAFLLHYLAYRVQLRPWARRFSPACVGVLRHCMEGFGDLSMASMASLLFADSIRPFLYLLFLCRPAVELLWWLYLKLFVEGNEFEVCIRQIRVIRRFVGNLCGITVSSSSNPRYILPR